LKKKIVIYTALFNDYDKLENCERYSDFFDFICFTDRPIKSKFWKIVLVKNSIFEPELLNRKYKILPHLFLKNYEISLYVDANIKILKNPKNLILNYIKFSDLIISKHFLRKCLYQEAFALIRSTRFNNYKIFKQIVSYAIKGMPVNFGLTENSIIIRKHNKPKVKIIMMQWWKELILGSHRDQLSLPYILWKGEHKILRMNEDKRNKNYFSFKDHNKKFTLNIKNLINSFFWYFVYTIFALIFLKKK
jgi:hypothetical protein